MANLLLDDLDQLLESRGHRFVRYAEDCNIYVRSLAAGQRVRESVTRFLEEKLKLRVNREKSAVAPVGECKFPGHRLLLNGKLGISPKSVHRAKEKIRQITRRNRGVTLAQVIVELNLFIVGWLTYDRFAAFRGEIQRLDEWIRRKLRGYRLKTAPTRSVHRRATPATGRLRGIGPPSGQFRERAWASRRLPSGPPSHVDQMVPLSGTRFSCRPI